MKRIVLIATVLMLAQTLPAQQMTRHTIRCGGLEREYYLYVPEELAPGRPLVVLLHGFGGRAEGYHPEYARCAARHRFALCVPQGSKSPKGKNSWNVHYPGKQDGMKVDDELFLMRLCRSIAKEYGLDRRNFYLSGMSNGGEMCYQMAYHHPEFWAGIASIAGLTLEWLMREGAPKGPVPFLEIHGTEDRTSEWNGDPLNKGGWGAYLSVPVAVGNIVAANKCTHCVTMPLPLLDPARPSRQVMEHRYLGGTEVLLYEVVGGGHRWHTEDIDTSELLFDFFERHIRK